MKPVQPRRRVLAIGASLVLGTALAWLLPRAGSAPAASPAAPADDLCLVAPPSPHDPASGLTPFEPRPIPPEARCPVCGMYPARFPRWAAQVLYEDGAAHFFDSPLNLLIFLARVERYSPYRSEQVVARYVNDVASDAWTDADTAFVVHGSNAPGPMRNGNLPAFARREHAEAFARERGGTVLPLREVPLHILESLATGPMLHHEH